MKDLKKIIPPSKGREFWQEIVDRYEQSGLTQAFFCQRHEVAISTFTCWLRKIRSEKKKSLSKFRPLRIVDEGRADVKTPLSESGGSKAESHPWFYEVTFKSGAHLKVPRDHSLKDLIAALV